MRGWSALVLVALQGVATADPCLKPAAAEKKLRAVRARNEKRLASALAKRGIKRVKLAQVKPEPTDPIDDQTIVNGAVWFKLRRPPCGAWVEMVELGRDRRGNLYRLQIEGEHLAIPAIESCGCPPPREGLSDANAPRCGLGGTIERLEGYKLPLKAKFKGALTIAYGHETDEIVYMGVDCSGLGGVGAGTVGGARTSGGDGVPDGSR